MPFNSDIPKGWPTTHWSLIGKAGAAGADDRRRALIHVVSTYSPVLKWHLLKRRRIRPDDIDDLVQEFLLSKVLEKGILEQADQTRGKFRSFLATALDGFVFNHLESLGAKKRGRLRVRQLDDDPYLPDRRQARPDSFDVAWARQVIGQAVRKMRAECARGNRSDIWGVFRARILAPCLFNAEPVAYRELVGPLALQSAGQANNLLITANRMFARLFRGVIGLYEKSEGEIDTEIQDLWQIVSGRRAG